MNIVFIELTEAASGNGMLVNTSQIIRIARANTGKGLSEIFTTQGSFGVMESLSEIKKIMVSFGV